MKTNIPIFLSFIITTLIFLYLVYRILSDMAKKSGEQGIRKWFSSFQADTEKWDQTILFSWEYHPLAGIRIVTTIIGTIMFSVSLYIIIFKPRNKDMLISPFYILLMLFTVLADNSKNSSYLLTDKGVYRIAFWRKKGRIAQKILFWEELDRYEVKDKQLILCKKRDTSKNFFSLPGFLETLFAKKELYFNDIQTLYNAVEITKQKLSENFL